jgi:hypothetical protein
MRLLSKSGRPFRTSCRARGCPRVSMWHGVCARTAICRTSAGVAPSEDALSAARTACVRRGDLVLPATLAVPERGLRRTRQLQRGDDLREALPRLPRPGEVAALPLCQLKPVHRALLLGRNDFPTSGGCLDRVLNSALYGRSGQSDDRRVTRSFSSDRRKALRDAAGVRVRARSTLGVYCAAALALFGRGVPGPEPVTRGRAGNPQRPHLSRAARAGNGVCPSSPSARTSAPHLRPLVSVR